jgi:hypothetical protein
MSVDEKISALQAVVGDAKSLGGSVVAMFVFGGLR